MDDHGQGSGTDVNEVRLVGRVSGEPTVRTLPSGDEVVTLRVVVSRTDGRPVDTGERLVAPPRTQGLSFDEGGHAWFTRSWGRTARSTLTRVSAAALAEDGGWTPDNGRDTTLPPMAEGSVVVAGRLHQLYESAAAPYRRHARPHHVRRLVLGRLEPRERLTVHDLVEDLLEE